jgi:hypothetical protein
MGIRRSGEAAAWQRMAPAVLEISKYDNGLTGLPLAPGDPSG